MEFISDFFIEGIAHVLGRVFMFLRYRNPEKRQLVLQDKYNNSYQDVAAIVLVQLIFIPILCVIGIGIIVLIFQAFILIFDI